MKQRRDWASIEKAAIETQKNGSQMRKPERTTNPMDTTLRVSRTLNSFPIRSRDPYYIYKLNDRRGNPNKPSFIFKASKEGLICSTKKYG